MHMANIFTKQINNLKNNFKRGLFDFLQLEINNQPSFFSNPNTLYTQGITTKIGEYDTSINPKYLYEAMLDPILSSSFNIIKNQVFEKNWIINGRKNTSKELTILLKNANIDSAFDKIFQSQLGAGGGNCLVFLDKTKKIVVEPFYAEGKRRIKVISDYNTRKIIEYVVINNNEQEVGRIKEKDCVHVKFFNPTGDFRWGSSPAVHSLKYWYLKKLAMMANETTFLKGSQAKQIITPDISSLSLGGENIANIKFWLDSYSSLIEKIKSTETVRGRNSDLYSTLPLKSLNLEMPTIDPRIIDFIQEMDKQIASSYLIALSNLGRTESANYSTSEQNRENINELNTDPIRENMEKTAEQITKLIYPNYNVETEPFWFGRDPSDEVLKMKEIRQNDFKIYVDNFIKLKIDGGIDLKIDENILKEMGFELNKEADTMIEKKVKELQTTNNIIDEEEQQLLAEEKIQKYIAEQEMLKQSEPTQEQRSSITNNNPIIDFENSEQANKIKDKLKKALYKQIKQSYEVKKL